MNSSLTNGQEAALRAGFLFGAVVAVWCAVHVSSAFAEESTSSDSTRVDCRYEGVGTSSNGGSSSLEVLPENDVFRPLWADLKQPQFFASWQATKVRSGPREYLNVGTVGFGDNFGLIGKRNGCDGWQVGILAGLFAQFDLDGASKDLINADYVVGIPISWRSGLFSARVRFFHQSSHLGDEFLQARPGFNNIGLSYEALEAILSLDAPGGWGRVYAGGATAVHIEPSTIDANSVHWGMELRGRTIAAPLLAKAIPNARFTPIFGADFQAYEALNWTINSSIMGGVEWSKAGSDRRFRFLINYYHGYAPWGQFFLTKIETVGFGLYLSF